MEKTLKKQHTEEKNPLGYEPLSKLLKAYAIPSIIAMLVSSLYNIVDQIFIGQGVGYLGNAATNVSYPLVTICLAIALLIGIGGAARFSLELGAGNKEKAQQSTGNAIAMMVIGGIIYFIFIQIFLEPLLHIFGSTKEVLPYAMTYTKITAIGMPFLILCNGRSLSTMSMLLFGIRFMSSRQSPHNNVGLFISVPSNSPTSYQSRRMSLSGGPGFSLRSCCLRSPVSCAAPAPGRCNLL